MISIADHLRNITHSLIEPVLSIAGCPEHLITEGNIILSAVDDFSEQTANFPNIDEVQRELVVIRKQVENFMLVVQKSC